MQILYEKECSKCHNVLHISEFRIKSDSRNKPRYSSQCNKCTREYQRRKRAENPSYMLKADEWKKTHKIEFLAQRKVQRAVKSGKITRPDLCSICGRKTKLQAHHTDYSQPLNVIWLCPSCHKKQHC